ncbi:MAG: M48 family metallopeptidase [Bacteroidales bacterium]|jgi:heat shock protein HtpX|nr:M48 family metallopeptidase [Bacteroidales bacterium]MCU0408866.1 M48 family metallopeptidase [Bacteroidales bacterium]
MKYFGLQSQIWRNNTSSAVILAMFPAVFVVLTWLFFYAFAYFNGQEFDIRDVNYQFTRTIPWVLAAVGAWFLIAYFSHSAMINSATGSKPLERQENKRVYNLVENLCISRGMTMPKVMIIEDDSLNAFASGIGEKSYSVSLSRGIINRLNDEELEAVIAHELTHIRNRDVRLLIISVVFVGIFAFISETIFRSLAYGGGRSAGKGKKGGGIIIILILALIGLLLASLFRFALSRKREYLADAGAAELTRNPLALASALRKISQDPAIEAVKRNDVAQMFIENPRLKDKKTSFSLTGLFATHPPVEKRIQLLEQY